MNPTDTGSAALGFALIGVCIFAYFFPTGIAMLRHHKNTLAIFMLNLFLGWSVLGWVGALVWACTRQSDVFALANAAERGR